MNNYQVGKSAVTSGRVSGAMAGPLSVGPATAVSHGNVIDRLIGRSSEHNEMLSRLIDRTRSIGDRMFGGNAEKEFGKDGGGPSNALGALESNIAIGEELATRLLEQISRLEVL